MSSYTAPSQIPTIFNPTTYSNGESTSKYLKLTGGTVSGSTTFSAGLNAGSGGVYTVQYTKGSAATWDTTNTNALGGVGFFKGSKTTGSYFIIKNIPASEFTGDWTIEWFARATNFTSGSSGIMLSLYPLNYLEATSSWSVSQILPYTSFRNGSGLISSTPGTLHAINTWRHFAVMYSKTLDTVYIASGQVSSTGSVVTPVQTNLGGITPADIVDMGLCFGARYSDFTFSDTIDLCHLRISKSVRYSSSYTVPTSAFVSDTNTILINTLNSSDLSACETRQSTTSGYGVVVSDSGAATTCKDVKTSVGSIEACYGKVKSYRDFTSTNAGWRIGPSSILSSGALATTSTAGCYRIASTGWTVASTTHEIHPTDFLLSIAHRSVIGQFRIFCSDKASSTSKNGVITADYYLQSGATTGVVFTISTTKTANLSTFSVAATAANGTIIGGLTITTDSACRIAWFFDGAI